LKAAKRRGKERRNTTECALALSLVVSDAATRQEMKDVLCGVSYRINLSDPLYNGGWLLQVALSKAEKRRWQTIADLLVSADDTDSRLPSWIALFNNKAKERWENLPGQAVEDQTEN
jgi:hypothetical protein